MKPIFTLLGAGFLLPLLNRFYELSSAQGGVVIREEGYHGQVYGIAVCVAASVACGDGVYRVCGRRGHSWWRAVRFRSALFALPILWQHWSTGRFASGAEVVTLTRGIGGPLTGEYFLAAAVALCLLDSFLSLDDFPSVGVMSHATSA